MHARIDVQLLCGILGCAMLVGCGEQRAATAGSPPAAAVHAPAPTDRMRVHGALLRHSDLPREWEARRPFRTRLRCGSGDPFATAVAQGSSRRFHQENSDIEEFVALFANDAASRSAFVRLNSRASNRCFRRDVRRSMSEYAEGAPVTPLTLVRDEPGRDQHAMRFDATVATELGNVNGYIDVMRRRVRRGIAVLVFLIGSRPLSEQMTEGLVALSVRRLGKTLG
jgi:hypothetical protein